MRHVLSSDAVATGTLGMGEATVITLLVALTGLSPGEASSFPRTAASAVDLAAIAAAADHHPDAATGTQEEPAGRSRCTLGAAAKAWTTAPIGGIFPRHSCSGTV
jgi:hypothetical protein